MAEREYDVTVDGVDYTVAVYFTEWGYMHNGQVTSDPEMRIVGVSEDIDYSSTVNYKGKETNIEDAIWQECVKEYWYDVNYNCELVYDESFEYDY